MDINEIEMPETATIHIQHPKLGLLYADDARTIAVTISVYSPASNAAIELKRAAAKRMAERMGRRGMKALSAISPEELEASELDRLCAMTADITGMEINGVPVTKEHYRELYSNPRLGWVREQVVEKIGSWEDFLN